MKSKSVDISLNPQQKEAVTHEKGPLLIIAGAGTGKTTVITERIKWLIEQKLASPQEILALTFTDKAAREMEERVDKALPYGLTQMWITTFHAFGDRLERMLMQIFPGAHIAKFDRYQPLLQEIGAKQTKFNLYICDWKMPGHFNGLKSVPLILDIHPDAVILGMHKCTSSLDEVLSAARFILKGAKGFIDKKAPESTWKEIINNLLK